MHVIRSADAADFLALAQPWLMLAEVEHNVILSIAAAIAQGSLVPKQPPYLAAVIDGGEVVACALRTPPHKLVLSNARGDAVQALVRDIAGSPPGLPAVNGPEPAAGLFAAAWAEQTGLRARLDERQRIYVATSVTQGLQPCAGALRMAEPRDRPLALKWAGAFAREAVPNEPFDPEEVIDRHLRSNHLFLWETTQPVSMLVAGGRTVNGARVGLVYTPPELRRNGYATAAVAALTARLFAQGRKHCCLYADLANPTSNAIYQRIGYRPLCDVSDYLLD